MTGSATQTEGAVFADRPIVSRFSMEQGRTDLASEAERYLAAVELFRHEGCEPDWRREPAPRVNRN